MDTDRIAVAALLFVFLGGSALAALWVVDRSLAPVALVGYLLIAVLFGLRLRRARSILEE